MFCALNSAKSVPARPLGPGSVGNDDTQYIEPTPKKKTGGFEPQRKDGRFFRSKAGVKICYAWARSRDGCSNDKCDKGFAYLREWRRQPYKSFDCPRNPGWNPEDKPKGGNKGKSRTGQWRPLLSKG